MLLSAGTKQLGKNNLASGIGGIASMAGKNKTKLVPGLVSAVGKLVGSDDDDDEHDDDNEEGLELDTSFLGKKAKNLVSNKLLCKYKQNAMSLNACIDIYMCTNIHTDTYIHTYIHTYTQTYICVNGYDNDNDHTDDDDDDDSVNN
jgi:hypothetical protein